jgi:WhiB family redox-sensing transcriptional regulator
MTNRDDNNLDWKWDAECAKPENADKADLFFSANADKRYEAKNLCFTCPVRAQCVKYALENKEIWGIWGGRDENEIRRTLSVNADGQEVRRGRYPQCPYCGARTSRLHVKTIDLPNGGRWKSAKVVECKVCGFEWRSRSSANAVTAYFAEREEKAARAAKRKVKKSPTGASNPP